MFELEKFFNCLTCFEPNRFRMKGKSNLGFTGAESQHLVRRLVNEPTTKVIVNPITVYHK